MPRLLPELGLTPDGWQRDRAVAITDGRITAVPAAGAPQPGDVALPGRALLPGPVNSHCHTFQSLLRGLGDDLDFMGWRDRVLCPFSGAAGPPRHRAGRRVRLRGDAQAGRHDVRGLLLPPGSGQRERRGGDRGRGHSLPHPRGRGAVRGRADAARARRDADRYLDHLGVLGPRMVGVHCVWLDDEEIALMGARGVDLGTRSAAALVGVEAGVIAAGRLADLAAIDLAHLSVQPRNDLLKSVVYAMSPEAVTDVWVHGRRVIEQRRLTATSEEDLVARVAALTRGWTV